MSALHFFIMQPGEASAALQTVLANIQGIIPRGVDQIASLDLMYVQELDVLARKAARLDVVASGDSLKGPHFESYTNGIQDRCASRLREANQHLPVEDNSWAFSSLSWEALTN